MHFKLVKQEKKKTNKQTMSKALKLQSAISRRTSKKVDDTRVRNKR